MTLTIPQTGYSTLAQLHPRLICVDKLPLRKPIPAAPRPRCRHASSSAQAHPQRPPKKRLWLRITILTATAAAVGAYIRSNEDSSETTLNPFSFTRYKLVSKQSTSSTISIFHLEPANNPGSGENKIYEDAWQKGIWSVQFKQPQLQIGRDYTPLPPPPSGSEGEDADDGTLRFLIRRDPRGEVSGYIHSLKEGSTVEIRGPQTECELPSDIKEVLFIAGGTGIAPAFQAAETLFRRRKSEGKTRMHILWANRRKEDCAGGISDLAVPLSELGQRSWWSRLIPFYDPKTMAPPPPTTPVEENIMVKELERLKSEYPGKITVDYFVDEENSFIGKDSILDFTTNSSNGLVESEQLGKKLILISGPDGFVNYFAGPKVWNHGKAVQGPLRGVLRQLHLNGWTIWKL